MSTKEGCSLQELGGGARSVSQERLLGAQETWTRSCGIDRLC